MRKLSTLNSFCFALSPFVFLPLPVSRSHTHTHFFSLSLSHTHAFSLSLYHFSLYPCASIFPSSAPSYFSHSSFSLLFLFLTSSFFSFSLPNKHFLSLSFASFLLSISPSPTSPLSYLMWPVQFDRIRTPDLPRR